MNFMKAEAVWRRTASEVFDLADRRNSYDVFGFRCTTATELLTLLDDRDRRASSGAVSRLPSTPHSRLAPPHAVPRAPKRSAHPPARTPAPPASISQRCLPRCRAHTLHPDHAPNPTPINTRPI